MSSNSTPTLLNPPSPRTHRALRRLQSAHTLGQNNPSLITQQHKQALQRNLSPANTPPLPTHSRGRSNSDATNMTQSNPGSAARHPMTRKRPLAADALSLDRLIRDGPPDGNLIGALESTRLKILDQGIKSDTDGMVRARLYQENFTNSFTVISTHLCMAHTTQCPRSRNRLLPRSHPPWCIPSIFQDPK
jgi:cell cycle arrest protein BUB2